MMNMLAPWSQSLNTYDEDGNLVSAAIPAKLGRTRDPYQDHHKIARGMWNIATTILKRGGYDPNGQPLDNAECIVCGVKFKTKRGHAKTCSERCRKRLQRVRATVKEELAQSTYETIRQRLEVDDTFADALRVVSLADGLDRESELDARSVKRASPMSGDLLENGRGIWDSAA